MSRIYAGAANMLNNNFRQIDSRGFVGFLRNDSNPNIEELIEGYVESSEPCIGGVCYNYHVKRLPKAETMAGGLPQRFVNSLQIQATTGGFAPFPKPVGLVYCGSFKNILLGMANCYFITELINGERCQSRFEESSEEERDTILSCIGAELKNLRGANVYLMDFAPRDIILKGTGHPIFADTENMEFHNNGNLEEEMKQKQISQSREDYSQYFTKEESMDRAVKTLFR